MRPAATSVRWWDVRSLHALMFRPGSLTREYLAGRRRRYVRAARLFVALSSVLFVVPRIAAGTPVIKETDGGRAQSVEGFEGPMCRGAMSRFICSTSSANVHGSRRCAIASRRSIGYHA